MDGPATLRIGVNSYMEWLEREQIPVIEERLGSSKYFSGVGDFIPLRPGQHMWETNFVPDLGAAELQAWDERGAGSKTIVFILADGTMRAHISEMSVGTYKKAHRHAADFHSCASPAKATRRCGMRATRTIVASIGSTVRACAAGPDVPSAFQPQCDAGPPHGATACGSLRYPFTETKRRSMLGGVSTSAKQGGGQIELEDQSPRIHELYKEGQSRSGGPHVVLSVITRARGKSAPTTLTS